MSANTGPLPLRVRAPMLTRQHVPPLDVEQLKRASNAIRRMEGAAPAVVEGAPAVGPRGSHPYSEGSRMQIAKQLTALGGGDTVMAPRLSAPPAGPATGARGTTPIGDAAQAYVTGTGPQPNFAPAETVLAPAPVPGWQEGVVRGLLIAALWEACRWYGDMDGTGCPGCEALGGLCDWHAPKYERYWEYTDLHDFCVDAGWDAVALRAVADSVRAGKADVADLASRGSHLDLILAGVLGTDRGAE